jgi:hypothetical protein
MNPRRLPFVELPLSLEQTLLSAAPAEPDPQVCRFRYKTDEADLWRKYLAQNQQERRCTILQR